MCPDIQFHENPLNASRADICEQMNRMTKLIGAFYGYPNAPKKP